MTRILGIDTSNYTTSVAVVEDGRLVYDSREILKVKIGERGLRQSEALFQHVNNLPLLLNSEFVRGVRGVCTSIKPRPVEGSYMPVFKAGESTGASISSALGVPLFSTTHQEGHIEAAIRSIGFEESSFYALHMSGGTTELLKVEKNEVSDEYQIDIVGGTKDISIGQFVDRIGVAMGLSFPAGKYVDKMSLIGENRTLRIPSKVDGLYFNLSGQETLGVKYIENGYNQEEISFSVMLCIAKTLEKVFNNLLKDTDLPVILIGGVASSEFLRKYFKGKYSRIFFSEGKYASDNAVGTAYIGYEKYKRGVL